MAFSLASAAPQSAAVRGTRVVTAAARPALPARRRLVIVNAPDRASQGLTGIDKEAKTPEQSEAPEGDRAKIGEKAQLAGVGKEDQAPQENVQATGKKDKRESGEGYDTDVQAATGDARRAP